MPKMREFDRGYLAALRDIAAVIENSYDNSAYEGDAIALAAVEKFIETRISPPKDDNSYRGYTFGPRPINPNLGYAIILNGSLISLCETKEKGRAMIDEWMKTR